MSVTECLVKGGIPDGWTAAGLAWLAETHRRLGKDTHTAAHGLPRSNWHRRWAACIEDILETYSVYYNRI